MAVIWGWHQSAQALPDPEQGLGYFLGIFGGSAMLLLLAYPIRKRSRNRAKAIGSVGFWFRFHMMLGLLGPLAILYHARFTFGSLNSAIALAAMIIVASSGLVGRFFYSRVHRGYSERKLELRSLKKDMDELLHALGAQRNPRSDLIVQLQEFESCAIDAGGSFWRSASAVLGTSCRSRIAEWRMRSGVPRDLHGNLAEFFSAVRRAAEFAFYDRLLRLWHLLHLPLFYLLVAAVVLHIVAVHMY